MLYVKNPLGFYAITSKIFLQLGVNLIHISNKFIGKFDIQSNF